MREVGIFSRRSRKREFDYKYRSNPYRSHGLDMLQCVPWKRIVTEEAEDEDRCHVSAFCDKYCVKVRV